MIVNEDKTEIMWIGRKPTEWNKFITTSRVIKTLRNSEPFELAMLLSMTQYEEPRHPRLANVFDNFTKKTDINLFKSPKTGKMF